MKVYLPENSGKDTSEGGGRDVIIFKKKRGQRKRKGSNIVKESSLEESSMASMERVDVDTDCCLDVNEGPEEVNLPTGNVKACEKHCGGHMQHDNSSWDLVKVMDSVMEHKGVSIIRSKLECQKRVRYKKIIRRHVDLQELRLRISSGSIRSLKELFRDLLLLANNAIVFYPMNSPEHKSAISLRELLNKLLQEHCRKRISVDDGGAVSVSVECKPMKSQALQACNGSKPRSSEAGGKVDRAPTVKCVKKSDQDEAPKASMSKKKVEIDKASCRETGQKASLVEAGIESSARKKAAADKKVAKPPALESGTKANKVHRTVGPSARKKSQVGGKVTGASKSESIGRSDVLLESPARKKSDVIEKTAEAQKLGSSKKGGCVEAPSESPAKKKTTGRAEKNSKRKRESPGKGRKKDRK